MAPPPQLVVGIAAVHNIVVAADRTLVVGTAAVRTPVVVAAAVAAIVRHNWNFQHHHRNCNCIAHCCIGRGGNVMTITNLVTARR